MELPARPCDAGRLKWTHLSRHFFKKIKLDFGRDNPILYLPCLPTKCGYMNCQGCAAWQLPKEPFTAHISALTLREGRDRIITCPSRLPLACGISTVSVDARDYKSSCNYWYRYVPPLVSHMHLDTHPHILWFARAFPQRYCRRHDHGDPYWSWIRHPEKSVWIWGL